MNTDPDLLPFPNTENNTVLYVPSLTSPAIDAGEAPFCTAVSDLFANNPLFSSGDTLDTDQVGLSRLPLCDIGALEYMEGLACVPATGTNIDAEIAVSDNNVVITTLNAASFQVDIVQNPFETNIVGTPLVANGSYIDENAILDQSSYYYRLSQVNQCTPIEIEDANWLGKFDFTLQPGS